MTFYARPEVVSSHRRPDPPPPTAPGPGVTETRVVKYADDGRTPLVIEHVRVDDEGTTWITQQNLETGEVHLHHIPTDR